MSETQTRRILVTGSSRGIGRALALGLAIFIVAIFPVGFLMFLVALLLVVCGWGCIRRR